MSDNPLARLQSRILTEGTLVLGGVKDVKNLKNRLRSRLNKAFQAEVLCADYGHLVWHQKRQTEIAVWGGVEINLDRDPKKLHFKRSDGAWFDFHMLLRPYAGDLTAHRGFLELLAYGYEIRFPPELGCDVRWLRFDLNPPGHDNDLRSVRAHFHPGDEDLQAPSPVLHPDEALDLLLSDLLQLPSKRRRPR